MTPLRQVVSAVADSSGAATWTLGPVSPGYVWSGTLSLHAPGAAATPGAARSSATVGGVVWMSWYGSGPAGPVQAQGSETISVTTSGLTAGTLYTLSLIGEISTQSAATAVSPAAVTTSTSVTGSTVDISGGTIVVEQPSATKLQVATNILDVTPSPAPSGTFSGNVTGIPPWATHLVVSATVPSGDTMAPVSVNAYGTTSLAGYANPATTFLTGNQPVVVLPVIGAIDNSVTFSIQAVVSTEGGTAPTYHFFAYSTAPTMPKPQIEVAELDGSTDGFLLTGGTSTQVFELLDLDLNINGGANGGADIQLVPPGGTIGGYTKLLRAGIAATSSSTSSVHAHLDLVDPHNVGYFTTPGIQLGVSVSGVYYNASVAYRTIVN